MLTILITRDPILLSEQRAQVGILCAQLSLFMVKATTPLCFNWNDRSIDY